MELHILRHGQAQQQASRDDLRELTWQGREGVRRIARDMQARGIQPDTIVISPYVRTRQTADVVLDLLESPQIIDYTPLLTPEADPQETLEYLQRFETARSMLLVSHQPLVTRLIDWLVQGTQHSPSEDSPAMVPGALARLSVDVLAQGCGHWQGVVTPDTVPDHE